MRCWLVVIAGVVAAVPAPARADTLRGLVFADDDHDGLPGAHEHGIANAVVAFGIDHYATTNAAGEYQLDVPAGARGIVWVRVPDGFAPGPVWASYDGAHDHDRLDLGLTPLVAPLRGPLTFVVAADSHIHTDQSQFGQSELADAVRQATALDPPPAFFTILGDVTQGNRDHEFDLVDAVVSDLDVPWVPVPGNHDWYDGGKAWFRRYGPDNYSFDIDRVHFVVWNMSMPEADIRAYLGAELAHVERGMTIVALTHAPPSVAVTATLRELGVAYVLTGHTHTNRVTDHDGVIELNTEPLIMGGLDFTPAGYRVVTIDHGVLTSVHHTIVDAPLLSVITPARGQCTAPAGAEVVVAAELDAAPIAVTATVDCGAPIALHAAGGWSWRAALPTLAAGAHALHVDADSASGTHAHVEVAIEACDAAAPSPSLGAWPQLGGDAAHTNARARELVPPLVTRWTTAIGGHVLQAAPVVADGVAYVTATDLGDGNTGALVALDLATGAIRWRHASSTQLRGGAAVVGDVVVIAQLDGTVLGLAASTGAERWRVALGDGVIPEAANIYASPVADHGDVVIGNQRALAAIGAATGTVLWTADPVPDGINSASAAALAIGDGVAIGTFNRALGGVIAWDRDTGRELWRFADERATAINASPLIADHVAYLVNGMDQVIAVDAATGDERWHVSLDAAGFDWGNATVGAPAFARGVLVVPTLYGDVVALDAETGTERWRHTGGPSPIHTTHYRAARRAGFEASPVVTGDLVWIAGTDGVLVALDLRTGAELWRTAIGAPILASPALAGETLVVASYDGTVRALAPAPPRAPLDPSQATCEAPPRGHLALLIVLAGCAVLGLGALLVLRARR